MSKSLPPESGAVNTATTKTDQSKGKRTKKHAVAALRAWVKAAPPGHDRGFDPYDAGEAHAIECYIAADYIDPAHYNHVVRRSLKELADAVVSGWDK